MKRPQITTFSSGGRRFRSWTRSRSTCARSLDLAGRERRHVVVTRQIVSAPPRKRVESWTLRGAGTRTGAKIAVVTPMTSTVGDQPAIAEVDGRSPVTRGT